MKFLSASKATCVTAMSSWRLLFANPLILTPWIMNAVVVALIQMTFSNVGGWFVASAMPSDGAIRSSPLVQRYIILSTILAAAYSSGMAQLILDQGKIHFSQANRIFKKSIRRLFLFASLFFLCTYIFHGVLSMTLKTPLFLIAFVIVFFSTYWIAAVVVGGIGLIDGFLISVKLASQKKLQTLTLYIAPAITCVSIFLIGLALYSCGVVNLSNAARILPLALLLSVPTMGAFTIAVVGEYRALYGAEETHQQTILEKRIVTGAIWGRRVLLSVVVGFLALLFFVHHGKSRESAPDPVRNDRLAREQITQFIEKSRSLSANRLAEKNAIDSVYGMVQPRSQAYDYLENWYPRHNPFATAFQETDEARVLTIESVMPNVYNVLWSERIRDKYGKLLDVQVWKGAMTVAFTPPTVSSTPDLQPNVFLSSVMWEKKSDIRYAPSTSDSNGTSKANGYWRLSPQGSYAGFQEVGGRPYCRYGEALSVRRLGFRMRSTSVVWATLQIHLEESAPACPYPPLPPSDQSYVLISQAVAKKTVDLTFLRKSENRERSRAHLHVIKRGNGRLSGTLVFRRVDAPPILTWAIPISVVMEPGMPASMADWKSVSPPSRAAPFITDALGAHIVPFGFQERSANSNFLFRTLGITTVSMQNPSNGTRIVLFSSNTMRTTREPKLSNSTLAHLCSSFASLPDDDFQYGNQHLSFQRYSCTGSKNGQTAQVETEMGNFIASVPAPRRITITMTGLQGTWDASVIRDLVHSFP